MSDAYIVRRGGGAKADVFAFIVVTYPAGSTLTATKGSKVLTAGDTTGKWVFDIPEAGTWVVTLTDEIRIKTKNVSVSEKGQREQLDIRYNVYYFRDGDVCSDVTGGWTPVSYRKNSYYTEGAPTVTNNQDSKTIAYRFTNVNRNNSGVYRTVNKIDVTNIDTLRFEISAEINTNISIAQFDIQIGISPLSAQYYDGNNNIVKVLTDIAGSIPKKIENVDVSNVTGTYYIYVFLNSATIGKTGNQNVVAELFNVWGES